MKSLKLAAIVILSFLVSIYAMRPELFAVGINVNPSAYQESEHLGVNLKADYGKLFDLDIPKRSAPEKEWRVFLGQVKLMTGDRVERPLFRYRSSAYPFLAYLAKHQPALLMQEVDEGNIDHSVFAMMLKMGLLQDWPQFVESTGSFIRSEPNAILALAALHGDDYAKEQARVAFLQTNRRFDVYPTSPRSLAYALDSMESQERRMVINADAEIDLSSPLTSLPVLAHYMDNEDYLDFIEEHSSKNNWEKGHLVDLFLAGDSGAGRQIKSQYLAAKKGEKNRFGYCLVCALALGFDEGVAQEFSSYDEVHDED